MSPLSFDRTTSSMPAMRAFNELCRLWTQLENLPSMSSICESVRSNIYVTKIIPIFFFFFWYATLRSWFLLKRWHLYSHPCFKLDTKKTCIKGRWLNCSLNILFSDAPTYAPHIYIWHFPVLRTHCSFHFSS